MDAAQKLGMWKMTASSKADETIVKGLEKAPEAITHALPRRQHRQN